MRLFDLLGRRRPESSVRRKTVRREPGPLTVHEAWELTHPSAEALDDQARLTLLTSGSDIDQDGRSFTWEFGFALPRRQRYGMFSVEPSGENEAIDDDPVVLVERLVPVSRSELKRHPTLPEPFRDSPEVVAELAAQGVDFVAGPTDMKLEARVLPSGTAVWVTFFWDEERTTPFRVES